MKLNKQISKSMLKYIWWCMLINKDWDIVLKDEFVSFNEEDLKAKIGVLREAYEKVH